MNQYFKPLVVGLLITCFIALSSVSVSASAQNQSTSENMTGGNMTAEGGNMTLQVEGTSGTNQSVARNESAGGGGTAPS
jgi:hypothetical protein